MHSNSQHLQSVVRRQIVSGGREPGSRINEVALAAEFEVSRTPARTALAGLEAEGLIEKREGRGYTVCSISRADVSNAIAVRATLEALAAKTMAETGLTPEVEATLLSSIATTEAILESDTPVKELLDGYHAANVIFHETIMQKCGNDLIAHTFERIAMLPLAKLGSLVFDRGAPQRERMRLTVGHSQHVILFDAIKQRDGARAEAMMREHSHATLNYADLFLRKTYGIATMRTDEMEV
ncbi:GntR family transcriptional regulator [Jannaschia sp. CCS1]|uniref:GntR family transcriptional regulator n=1 Tax=Jannaschia sp. (strain CCS1) TaxID=290400 RepID=UPI000053BBB3|nr:GntR family transcriptional regulator [Jannaschia sp. CCS1]ABD56705.1 transcriptional regulator, GntR family [Jannaschia sp. CCS1]